MNSPTQTLNLPTMPPNATLSVTRSEQHGQAGTTVSFQPCSTCLMQRFGKRYNRSILGLPGLALNVKARSFADNVCAFRISLPKLKSLKRCCGKMLHQTRSQPTNASYISRLC